MGICYFCVAIYKLNNENDKLKNYKIMRVMVTFQKPNITKK